MIYSNSRKLELSGWLANNNPSAYRNALKFQKFLFFYESMCKVLDKEYDFHKLKGYKNGPVFSDVYGDYTKDSSEFYPKALEYYNSCNTIDSDIVLKASFLVSILTEEELSSLTHNYNIWKCKEQRINSGELQVSLDDEDFNENDYYLTNMLLSMYPSETINEYIVYSIGLKNFLVSKNDIKKIDASHMDILAELSKNTELMNPVYVSFTDDGGLEID